MPRTVSMLTFLMIAVIPASGCSLGDASRPTETDALDGLVEVEGVVRDLVVDVFGAGVAGEWQRELVDDACSMTCTACDETQSKMELIGDFKLEEYMSKMASSAEAAGGSAGETELFGETYNMYVEVPGEQGEHRISVALDGTTATIRLTTDCYRTDSATSE